MLEEESEQEVDLAKVDNKYTMIDNLTEDKVIDGQKFVLMSYVSPEGLMNCNIRGVKIRGVFNTEDEARKKSEELRKVDKYFDIFIGEVGKWLPWDPDPMSIQEAKYGNKKLNTIMKKVHDMNCNNLNELVGRKKEEIDNSKITHKERVAQSIKDSASVVTSATVSENASASANTLNMDEPELELKAKPKQKQVFNTRQEKLRNILEERRATRQANSSASASAVEELETDKLKNNLDKMKSLYNDLKE
jgi:hypothetical protein